MVELNTSNGHSTEPSTLRNGKLLTVGEAARLLNAHPNSVRRWSDMGILRSYRIGCRGDRRFSHEDISRFITSPQQ